MLEAQKPGRAGKTAAFLLMNFIFDSWQRSHDKGYSPISYINPMNKADQCLYEVHKASSRAAPCAFAALPT